MTFRVVINVPDYLPRKKHPAIFKNLDKLILGEFMQIVNDHDPALQYQFMMERPEAISWEYLEEGAETWRGCYWKKEIRKDHFSLPSNRIPCCFFILGYILSCS